MESTLGEIAALVSGEVLRGEPGARLTNFAALDQADATCVSFFGNEKYRDQLAATVAGAVLVPSGAEVDAPDSVALVAVENPALAFDQVVRHFGVSRPSFVPGVHPSAWVSPDAALDPGSVSVGPNASVLAGAKVGRGTRIAAGAVVCEGAVLGEDCEIGPNVSIREGCLLGDRVIVHAGAVIGADGFGFEFVEGRHRKIDQLGIVRLGDDVEIGASTTIDRARFGETVVGEGTKIDNQVQIAHNVVIGRHCIIVAQTGIAGSVRIGDYVTLAAQTGVAGHLRIADRVTCGGRSGVIASIEEPGGTYFGYPAKPMKENLRDAMRVKQLGGLLKRVKALEKRLSGAE
jgi:UDP-3-O-[3-hydroxymyristoyl] glucosamine N-acyltransferase